MKQNQPQTGPRTNILHNPMTAWIVLFLSMALTIAAYMISNAAVKKAAHNRFEFRVHEVEVAIQERLRVYEQLLWSCVGLMYASDSVERDEFENYIATMNIEKNWPGIQGIGYSIPVLPQEKDAHIEKIRAEGFADYVLKPEGERDFYTSIIYIEPFDWRNQRAFGYDMWSNEVRRESMKKARDEGTASTSGAITLVQETEKDIQAGFLTYVPVYKSRHTPDTLEERRAQFQGWIYAAYRAGNLMQGILGKKDRNIEFEIYDGAKITPETLLYDSRTFNRSAQPSVKAMFTETVQVINQGRLWTLRFYSASDYLSTNEKNQPVYLAVAGALVDLLLFYVIWALYFINKKAQSIAADMTRELKKANYSLEETVQSRTAELQKARDELEQKVQSRTEELALKLRELERMNEAMVGRESKMIELKKEIERLRNLPGGRI